MVDLLSIFGCTYYLGYLPSSIESNNAVYNKAIHAL